MVAPERKSEVGSAAKARRQHGMAGGVRTPEIQDDFSPNNTFGQSMASCRQTERCARRFGGRGRLRDLIVRFECLSAKVKLTCTDAWEVAG